MSGLLNIGARALAANYTVLQTVGHNIANANTPGYSRQQVDLANEGGNFSGAGLIGRGVKVQTITRYYNDFLNKESATSASLASASQTRYERLQQLENLFPMGEAGIGYAAGQFFNAFVDVANNPQDLSARQVVLGQAEALAGRFREASEQLNSMQNGVTEDIRSGVASVNSLASQIANLNQEIARLHGTGQAPNDLLDQRDQLVRRIGEQVQVTTIAADDGSLGVFVGGGQRLVLGNVATPMSVTTGAGGQAVVQLNEVGGTVTLDADRIGGGSIGGLLRYQSEDLVQARTLLEDLAQGIVDAVNTQQAAGLNLKTPATAGVPLFAQNATDPLLITVATTDPRDIAAASSTAANPAANNENALAFVALRQAALVNGDSITDAYAQAMTDIGVRVQTAKVNADTMAAAAQQTESTRSAASGVNLDEEAAKLIQFQQSYQAAAKVLQIAQTIFDNVLAIAGR